MLVEQAVKLRNEGKTAWEIVNEIETLRSKLVLYACMNTLEYLHRGGRISTTAYKVGSFANIKPIITIDQNGYIQIPSKAMGTRKVMDYMCRQLESKNPDESYPLYVMFTGNRENGEILAERIRGMGYSIPDERIINVGAAIGSHIGPNACGLVYISKTENA